MIDIAGRMRVGYKAEVEVWRDRSRKTFRVDITSASQTAAAEAATAAKSGLPEQRARDFALEPRKQATETGRED